MADNKDKSQQGKQDMPDQDGAQNRQSGSQGSQSGSGQYTGGAGAGESRQSGFVHSSPEANVFPAGSRQGDNSDRSAGGGSAAGTPDEGRLGGTGGTSAAGTTGNDADR
jgi:hypothetical protein